MSTRGAPQSGLRLSLRVVGPGEALHVLRALVAINLDQIRAGGIPPLYRSGVRYQREKGTEDWLSARDALALGVADCEDLACWRVAELQAAGEKARIAVKRVSPRLTHILVIRPGGRLEDPSARLGMRGDG